MFAERLPKVESRAPNATIAAIVVPPKMTDAPDSG
jgi:hypothetical protein